MEDFYLLEMIQQGDSSSYKKLFIRYYSPLCKYASRYVPCVVAEDIVEDLMLFIWERRETLLISTSVKSYLFTAIKHRSMNALKMNKRHEVVHDLLHDKYQDKLDDPDCYIFNELFQKIEETISKLPGNYKEVFLKSRFENKTNKQIAEQLDISVKTVEYRMTQALKYLRYELKEFLILFFVMLCG